MNLICRKNLLIMGRDYEVEESARGLENCIHVEIINRKKKEREKG